MTDKTDIETALRATLAAHARHAPAADAVADRILADIDLLPAPDPRRHRQWRTWTLPLVAAGTVAAVAAALFAASQVRHVADHRPPAVPFSSVVPAPSSTAALPTSAPRPISTRSRSVVVNPAPLPSRFAVLDLTFASADEGWALGTANCSTGGGTCTALVRTADGGQTWHGTRAPPANVEGVGGCADPCVRYLRFATDRIGYAYGPSALFMTTDGGARWTRGDGGADALETLDGNVIRVAARNGCSPPGCVYGVQIAAIGSLVWHDVGLSATTSGTSVAVALTRTGHRAFVEVFGHTSGGAQNATSALFASADDGVTWAARGEPCPQTGGEIDSTHLASAPDGSVTAVCTPRGGQRGQFTCTSVDGGVSCRPGAAGALGSAAIRGLGAASRWILIVSSDAAYRSTDGGQIWHKLSINRDTPGQVRWLGFESATTGRAVSADGRVIWTTRDAGLTWTSYLFH